MDFLDNVDNDLENDEAVINSWEAAADWPAAVAWVENINKDVYCVQGSIINF